MNSDPQFERSSSATAFAQINGLISMGNNTMVDDTVAVTFANSRLDRLWVMTISD